VEFCLEDDVAISLEDVVEGKPTQVVFLTDKDRRDDGMAVYREVDPEDAASLDAWRQAR